MNSKRETLLKAAILAASALMFYAKISTGTLAFYINQRFAWLSLVAVLLFAVLALTTAYRLVEGTRHKAQGSSESPNLRQAQETVVSLQPLNLQTSNASSHGKTSALGLALVALPALLGLLVPARPLTASSIESRGIGLTAPKSAGGGGTVTTAQRAQTGPRNILDWLREFSRSEDVARFNGQSADVIGFVYKDPRSSENQFWVSRFTVSCCVADSAALGLLVQSAEATKLQTDSWVRVVGKFQVGNFAGDKMPMIVAEKIESVPQPNQPYLYP
jgi:uncharacterized repeat protein (TIGR03943 family)